MTNSDLDYILMVVENPALFEGDLEEYIAFLEENLQELALYAKMNKGDIL